MLCFEMGSDVTFVTCRKKSENIPDANKCDKLRTKVKNTEVGKLINSNRIFLFLHYHRSAGIKHG